MRRTKGDRKLNLQCQRLSFVGGPVIRYKGPRDNKKEKEFIVCTNYGSNHKDYKPGSHSGLLHRTFLSLYESLQISKLSWSDDPTVNEFFESL